MAKPAKDRGLFHTAHYNIIAKQIRENLEGTIPHSRSSINRRYAAERIVNLAISIAKRFEEDNPSFDPLKFLDQCSPNVDLYPLSELWEDYDA